MSEKLKATIFPRIVNGGLSCSNAGRKWGQGRESGRRGQAEGGNGKALQGVCAALAKAGAGSTVVYLARRSRP